MTGDTIKYVIEGIRVYASLDEDGDWVANGWFDGKSGATYKCFGVATTEQEAIDCAVSDAKNHTQWHQPAPVASTQDGGITAHLESYFMDDEPTHATEQMWIDAAALSDNDAASTQDALTPDNLSANEMYWLRAVSSEDVPAFNGAQYSLSQRGFIEAYDKPGSVLAWYRITAAGREHLAALASTPVDVATDATMLVRKSSGGKTLGDPAFYIYPFLTDDSSESAIEEGTFVSAYPHAIEGASFGMDYNEIAMNAAQVRKLIAALEYALSTITE